jgi:hypothetical protein
LEINTRKTFFKSPELYVIIVDVPSQFNAKFNVTDRLFWRLYDKYHFFPGIGQQFGSTFVLSHSIPDKEDPPMKLFSMYEVIKIE